MKPRPISHASRTMTRETGLDLRFCYFPLNGRGISACYGSSESRRASPGTEMPDLSGIVVRRGARKPRQNGGYLRQRVRKG